MSNINRPHVSIIMAAYNAEQFITEAIESLINQTYANIEIIIIDDGSTDNTKSAVSPLLVDGRIKYFFQTNGGQTVAKNRGVKESSGDVIAFCDADDYWHHQKLEKQLAVLGSDKKIGVVYSDIQAIDENGGLIKQADKLQGQEGYILDKLLFDNFIPFGSAIIRRACIEEHGSFNEQYRMGIDWDLWLRIATSWKFGFASEKLYFYREWSGQMSRNYNGRYASATIILMYFQKAFPHLVNRSLYRKAISDVYANHAYHISLYEGYTWTFFKACFYAIRFGYDQPRTVKRVVRSALKRF